MREIKTVALIGLGSIGSFLASHLQDALGYDNLRIIAEGERKERIDREGILVNEKPYHFLTVSPEQVMEPADLAIFITKAGALEQALPLMHNQIGKQTIIMCPLNGVESESVVASYYDPAQILYSLARVSVVKTGNQVSYNEKVAHMEYGEKDNIKSERICAVNALFDRANIVSVLPEDMEHAMWHKFMCNVSENQSSAILGIPFGAWRVSEHANWLREEIMHEVARVAATRGIVLTEQEILSQRQVLARAPFSNKPSTLQDIEAGRATEVEIFAGAMMRMGKEAGIPTPYNDFMYHCIKVLEEKNDGLFREQI